MKRVRFIINPISGTVSKSGIPEAIDEYLDKSKFSYEILETQYAGQAEEMSRKAAADGIDIVVAIGGDGTVNEVARGITHTSTALGIIPCGSGNGLARHLLIPINIKKSLEIINACEIQDLDYGNINGHDFFCTCGMGFDAFISFKFAEAGKRGPITYVQQVLESGLKYKPQTYELSTDEDTTTYKALLVTCANASQYGNNAYIAPQASMSDGLMDVVIMEPFDFLEAPQIAIDIFSKTLDKSSRIKTFRTRHLHVHRSKEGPIHFDGEPTLAGTDIDVSVVPKGIKWWSTRMVTKVNVSLTCFRRPPVRCSMILALSMTISSTILSED
jgi:diacylglycerol kinase (ATP)